MQRFTDLSPAFVLRLLRAKPNLCSPDITIRYINRYLGRPAIAPSRINAYNGDSVTFHCQQHEDNQTITEQILAVDVIKCLILNIPDKHFKMVRYYGIYAKHHNREKSQKNLYPIRGSNIFPVPRLA